MLRTGDEANWRPMLAPDGWVKEGIYFMGEGDPPLNFDGTSSASIVKTAM